MIVSCLLAYNSRWYGLNKLYVSVAYFFPAKWDFETFEQKSGILSTKAGYTNGKRKKDYLENCCKIKQNN